MHRSARRLASSLPCNWTSLHVLNAFLDAMAPKATDKAYVTRDAALPDARQDDWNDIARFLAMARQLTHSGNLRHAFARLDLDVIQRFEQECSVWRAQTRRLCAFVIYGRDARGHAPGLRPHLWGCGSMRALRHALWPSRTPRAAVPVNNDRGSGPDQDPPAWPHPRPSPDFVEMMMPARPAWPSRRTPRQPSARQATAT